MFKFLFGLLAGFIVGTTACAVMFVEADAETVNDLKRVADAA